MRWQTSMIPMARNVPLSRMPQCPSFKHVAGIIPFRKIIPTIYMLKKFTREEIKTRSVHHPTKRRREGKKKEEDEKITKTNFFLILDGLRVGCTIAL